MGIDDALQVTWKKIACINDNVCVNQFANEYYCSQLHIPCQYFERCYK